MPISNEKCRSRKGKQKTMVPKLLYATPCYSTKNLQSYSFKMRMNVGPEMHFFIFSSYNSCWFWEGLNLFKLEGKQVRILLWSTIAWSTKERRRAGFNGMSLLPGCGWGLWGKPCKPPCRGTSLPGPEEARSPVLICTYPYTGSCHWKGSTGELIGPIRKWERRTVCNWLTPKMCIALFLPCSTFEGEEGAEGKLCPITSFEDIAIFLSTLQCSHGGILHHQEGAYGLICNRMIKLSHSTKIYPIF